MELFRDILNVAGSLIFVFVAIGLCIFSHELGHFLAGIWRGLHIDAFSLGFKPVWRKKIRGVEYRIGWLPFGGYVELPQIDAADEIPKSADGKELKRAKPLDRVITAAAGPVFNILFGLLVGCIVWLVGIPQDTAKMREITVRSVDPEGPEYKAGLRSGDRIVKLNGKNFHLTWAHFVKEILFTVDPVEFEILRGGERRTISYIPKVNPHAPGTLSAEGIAWPFFTALIPIAVHPESGSIAKKAGLRSGDIITSIDGQQLDDPADFQFLLDAAGDRPVTLVLNRDGKNIPVTLRSEAIPGLSEEFTRYVIGVTMKQSADGAVAVGVVPGSPAEKAGVRIGDRLLNALPCGQKRTEQIRDLTEFITRIRSFKDRKFALHYSRGGVENSVEIACVRLVPRTIGIRVAVYDHPTPWAQFVSTVEMSWKSLRGICIGIGSKLGWTEKQSSLKPSHMSGPLGIGTTLFNSVYHSSLMTGIYFMVVISFALAIFNLLPLPVLDGGHIFFGVIEMIFGKPMPVIIIKGLSYVFVTLLISLMLFVTFADGRRLVRDIMPKTSSVLQKGGTPDAPETQKPQP